MVRVQPQPAKGFQGELRWPLVRIGEVANLHYGKALTARSRRPGDVRVYGSNGQCGWHDAPLGAGPTVILGRKGQGPLGVEWCPWSFWVIDTAYHVTVDTQRIDLRYFYFLTKFIGLNHLKDGTSNPSLSRDVFGQQGVPLPSLSVQRRLTSILSAYDELIENSQRRIRILEAVARALYREWFVYFRFPGHENHPRVPSPLGKIPEGWEVKKLGEVARSFRGRSYRSADLVEAGGLPFLNLKCLVRDGGFRRSGLKRYAGKYKDIHVAKKGDIIMGVTDMTQERRIIARAALVPTLENDFGIFSMDLVRIEPKPELPKVFLYSLLRYSSFADEVKQHANGANVLHLSPDRITDFRFPAPPTDLMLRFASFSAPVLEELDTLANKNDNLRRTRDLLLPRLLSGQLELEAA